MIGVGFTEIDAMKAVAKTFPKTHFAIVDVSNADEGNAPNVEGLLFKEQQVGYLAGYAAGLAAKADGATAVSSVGGAEAAAGRPLHRRLPGRCEGGLPGRQDAERLLAGLRGRRRSARRSRSTRSPPARTSSSRSRAAAASARSTQRRRRASGAIGVDADQGFLGPHILTSALKGVDTAVFLSIKDAKDGHFKGGQDAVYGLEQKGVGLGKFSPKAPKGIEAKVKKIEQQIIDGKIANIPTTVK